MSLIAIALLALSAADTPAASTDFADLAPLAAAVAKADAVTLYEGLPHQIHEKELLEAELKSKKTVRHHGFAFYAAATPLKPGDGKALMALASNPKSFRAWAGAKLCGGFHPDYLVEFKVGPDVYRLLVCFGCHEVKLFGPKGGAYADMSDDGLHGLEKVLKPYRTHRPKAGD